jgi:hypothetical protein
MRFVMTDTPKLYHASASPNSRRVRIFAAEKGIALPLMPIDLGQGEQHSAAYRAINPRRVVPTLVLEDGTAIGEVWCGYVTVTRLLSFKQHKSSRGINCSEA